jgi:hypothetical protein
MNYYTSSKGLKGLKHLFQEPVEVLANRHVVFPVMEDNLREFHIVGEGENMPIFPHWELRKLLRHVPFLRRISSDVRDKVLAPFDPRPNWRELENADKCPVTLETLLREVARSWDLTPSLAEFISVGYGISLPRLKWLMRQYVTMPSRAFLSIQKERILQDLCHYDDKVVKFYKHKLQVFEFMRATFDTVCCGFQRLRKMGRWIPSSAIRALAKLKLKIWNSPDLAAQEVKQVAAKCYEYFFSPEGVFLHSDLIRWLGKVKDRDAIVQLSAMGRALPSPLKIKDDLLRELEARLTSNPEVEDPGWRPWVRNYLLDLKSKVPFSYFVEPSVSGAIGYLRKDMGHSKAYMHLVSLGLSLHIRDNEPTTLLPSKRPGWVKLDRPTDEKVYKIFKDNFPKFIPPKNVSSVQKGFLTPNYFEVEKKKVYKGLLTLPCWHHLQHVDHAWRTFADGTVVTPEKSGKDHKRAFAADRKRTCAQIHNKYFYAARDSSVRGNNSLNKFLSERMMEAAFFIVENTDILPVQPLVAAEKGLKTRIPTKSLTAVNLLQSVLRKAMDSLLMGDPSCSKSLGGNLDLPAQPRGTKLSIDLSSATDFHPFWLTITAYEELCDLFPNELGRFKPLLPKLLGSKLVVEPMLLEQHYPPPEPEIPLWSIVAEFAQPLLVSDKDCPALPEDWRERAQMYPELYISWVRGIREFTETEGRAYVTTVGEMMGDPTSFPIMPMVTIYVCHQLRLPSPQTYGDDGVLTLLREVLPEDVNGKFRSLGSRPSEAKTWVHPTDYLFCEVVYKKGKPLYKELLSLWSAPPGASKGTLNWYNLPSSQRGQYVSYGSIPDKKILKREGLYPYSKFVGDWEAALHMGIPLGAVGFMGGISHPSYPVLPRKELRLANRWMALLSSMPLRKLIVHHGLTLVESNSDKRLATITEHQFDLLFAKAVGPSKTEGATSVTEAANRFKEPITTSLIFDRGIKPNVKTPSVYRLANKFRHRVMRTKPGRPGSYSKLRLDLESKRDRDYTGTLPKEGVLERTFGPSHHASPLRLPGPFVKRFWSYQTLKEHER